MKNRFLRRGISLALSAVMTAGMLAGCGGTSSGSGTTQSTGSSGASSEAPVELTVFSQLANFSGPVQGWGGDLLLDKFNVILNIVPDQNGAMSTRLEEGNLGDIVVFGADGDDYIQAIDKGLLLDWNEDDVLEDYGQDILKNFPDALEKNSLIQPEGGEKIVHGFGHNVGNTGKSGIDSVLYTWDVRWDLYEQLGHPAVNELEDFVDLFIDMKELCPTDDNGNPTYAFSMWPDWDGNMVMYVKAMASAYYGYDEFGFGLYDPETGDFYDCLAKDGPYMRVLKFMNTLYRNGLIDPDSMTATFDTASEKMKSSGAFCSIFNYAGRDAYNTVEHAAENRTMQSLVPANARPIVYGLSSKGGNRVWTIGSKTEYPELCMEVINFLSTPEGAMTMWYGPKGVCWDYDEDGYIYFTELGKAANLDPDGTSMEEAGYKGSYQDGIIQINNTTWSVSAFNPDSAAGEVFNSALWKSEQAEASCAAEQDWRDFTGYSDWFNYECSLNYLLSPGSDYSEGSRDDVLTVKWNAIADTIVKGSWNAIYASSDDEYEKIVAEMYGNAMSHGYRECIDWCVNEAAIRKAAEDAAK